MLTRISSSMADGEHNHSSSSDVIPHRRRLDSSLRSPPGRQGGRCRGNAEDKSRAVAHDRIANPAFATLEPMQEQSNARDARWPLSEERLQDFQGK